MHDAPSPKSVPRNTNPILASNASCDHVINSNIILNPFKNSETLTVKSFTFNRPQEIICSLCAV